MRLLVATMNAGKLREYERLLADVPGLEDAGATQVFPAEVAVAGVITDAVLARHPSADGPLAVVPVPPPLASAS